MSKNSFFSPRVHLTVIIFHPITQFSTAACTQQLTWSNSYTNVSHFSAYCVDIINCTPEGCCCRNDGTSAGIDKAMLWTKPSPHPHHETRHFPTCIECPVVQWRDSRGNLMESAQLVHKSFAYSPWIIDICCQIEDFFFLLYVSRRFSMRQRPEWICSVQSEWDWLCGKMSALSHFFLHMYDMWKMSHSFNVRKKLAWFDTHVHIVHECPYGHFLCASWLISVGAVPEKVMCDASWVCASAWLVWMCEYPHEKGDQAHSFAVCVIKPHFPQRHAASLECN